MMVTLDRSLQERQFVDLPSHITNAPGRSFRNTTPIRQHYTLEPNRVINSENSSHFIHLASGCSYTLPLLASDFKPILGHPKSAIKCISILAIAPKKAIAFSYLANTAQQRYAVLALKSP
jgi:hypothetical protein